MKIEEEVSKRSFLESKMKNSSQLRSRVHELEKDRQQAANDVKQVLKLSRQKMEE